MMGGGPGGGGRGGGGRGGPRRPAPPQPGANVRHELDIPLEVAVRGGTTEFYLSRGDANEKIAVNIPAGVETGSKIRLRERGQPSPNGGPQGDLILLIKVSEHPHFKRHGRNLEVNVPISIGEAVLGGKIDVPTPDKTVAVTVPPGTTSGSRLRLKGQGVKDREGNAGDLLVVLQIQVPKSIDDESKKLIEQFESQNPLSLRSDLRF